MLVVLKLGVVRCANGAFFQNTFIHHNFCANKPQEKSLLTNIVSFNVLFYVMNILCGGRGCAKGVHYDFSTLGYWQQSRGGDFQGYMYHLWEQDNADSV